MLIKNRPVFTPASANSPWSKLFGIVTKLDRLSRVLLTPDLTGDGKVTRADVLKGRGVFGAGGGVRGSTKSADIYSRLKQRDRLKQIRKNFKKGKK